MADKKIPEPTEQAEKELQELAKDPYKSDPSDYDGLTRRSLCLGVGGVALLLGLGTLKFMPAEALVRPPGGQDEARLIGGCIRCEKCVEVCPHHAIKLAKIEDGILGVRTPQMDFSSDWCDFCAEKNDGKPLCVHVCPTNALELPEGIPAEELPIGKAKLIEDWCLAYHDTGCHVCYDVCEYNAIELDEHHRPYVIPENCNGCGACEAVCISLSSGSKSLTSGATSRAIIIVPSEA